VLNRITSWGEGFRIDSFEAVLFSPALNVADGEHSSFRTDAGSMAAVRNWSDCLQPILAAIVSG